VLYKGNKNQYNQFIIQTFKNTEVYWIKNFLIILYSFKHLIKKKKKKKKKKIINFNYYLINQLFLIFYKHIIKYI